MFLARPDVDEDVLFILRHSGKRNERTDFEEIFLAEKRKSDSACKNSSDKRQTLNFFWTFQKKFLSKQGFYSEPNIRKFQEKTKNK